MDIKNSWLTTRPIAHRGLHDQTHPENSISAFKQAIEKGYPIELDVRLIDDGNVVVFHDDLLSRMTNKDGYITALTAQDLKEITLIGSNEHIPTFSQVLEEVNGQVPLLIEIKNESKVGELEEKSLQILKTYKGEFAVQSFNPYSLEYYKKNAPMIWRGQLSSFFTGGTLKGIKKYLLKRLKLDKVSEPDFISYNSSDLPNKYVTKARLPLLAWTVTTQAEEIRLENIVDNIIFQDFIPKQNK